MAATPALLRRQMSGNYAKTLAINKCKKATTVGPPGMPGMPPAISEIRNPNPKSAPLSRLICHICLICILLHSGGRRGAHNNPQHGHNRYLVIVVGLYALSQLIYINRHAKLAQSQLGRDQSAHTASQTHTFLHTHTAININAFS